MKSLNVSKNVPIQPEINADGWYCQCKRCWNEVEPSEDICPSCGQVQDWSWFGNQNKK